VLGALLIGFLGSKSVAGANGLFYGGGWSLLGKQALAVISTVAYSFIGTFIIAWVMNKIWKMKMTEDQELEGMDTVLHNETAYDWGGLGGGGGSLTGSAHSTISIPREEVDA
jgi:Amt family ammonium transporter